jgi:formiminotetrahydrofolate cyclodeaminase
MSENIQKSPSLNQMVDAFTHLKQWLESFERQVQNSKNQELRKEYFRTLAQDIEAENALRHFVKVFYNDSDSEIRNSLLPKYP